jgi:hypothetical protein
MTRAQQVTAGANAEPVAADLVQPHFALTAQRVFDDVPAGVAARDEIGEKEGVLTRNW